MFFSSTYSDLDRSTQHSLNAILPKYKTLEDLLFAHSKYAPEHAAAAIADASSARERQLLDGDCELWKRVRSVKTQLKFNCLAMMATAASPSSSSSSSSSAFADDLDLTGLCFAIHLCAEQVLLSYATVFEVPLYTATRRKKKRDAARSRSRSRSPSRRHGTSEPLVRRPFAAITDDLLALDCLDGATHACLSDLHAWSGASAAALVHHGLTPAFTAGLRAAVAALIDAVTGYYALVRMDLDEVCLEHRDRALYVAAGPADRRARLVADPDPGTRLRVLSGSAAEEVADPFYAGGLLLGEGGDVPVPRPRLLQQGDSDVCLQVSAKGTFLTHDSREERHGRPAFVETGSRLRHAPGALVRLERAAGPVANTDPRRFFRAGDLVHCVFVHSGMAAGGRYMNASVRALGADRDHVKAEHVRDRCVRYLRTSSCSLALTTWMLLTHFTGTSTPTPTSARPCLCCGRCAQSFIWVKTTPTRENSHCELTVTAWESPRCAFLKSRT